MVESNPHNYKNLTPELIEEAKTAYGAFDEGEDEH